MKSDFYERIRINPNLKKQRNIYNIQKKTSSLINSR